MSALESRQSTAQLRRLQTLLLLMILWDLLAVMAEFSFGSGLMKIDGDRVGGFLGGRASMSGAALVTVAVYFYGLVRNPFRHPGVIWVAIIAQSSTAFFGVYHYAAGNLTLEAMLIATIVALVLLFLLIVNMPRGAST